MSQVDIQELQAAERLLWLERFELRIRAEERSDVYAECGLIAMHFLDDHPLASPAQILTAMGIMEAIRARGGGQSLKDADMADWFSHRPTPKRPRGGQ
jgi:hypothetical protein